MLLEVIFLVLSAVVLTVVGVGFLDGLGNARVRKGVLEGKAGSYTPSDSGGFIDVAEAIKTFDGPIYRLSKKEQKVVVYHEKFHELASKLGYTQEAEREDYADLAAIYALVIEGDKETASEGMDFLKKIGRSDYIDETAIRAINKYLAAGKEGKLTDEEEEKLLSGLSRTGKLINEAYERLPSGQHGLSDTYKPYDMSLHPILYNEKGESRFKGWLSKAWEYIDLLYNESNRISNNLKNTYSEHGYKSAHEVLNESDKLYNEFVGRHIDGLLGRKGSGSRAPVSTGKPTH